MCVFCKDFFQTTLVQTLFSLKHILLKKIVKSLFGSNKVHWKDMLGAARLGLVMRD